MSICEFCDKEMKTTTSCVAMDVEFKDGIVLKQLAHNDKHNCGDCGTPNGGFHHVGCDVERCPRCDGQLISCNCGGGFK